MLPHPKVEQLTKEIYQTIRAEAPFVKTSLWSDVLALQKESTVEYQIKIVLLLSNLNFNFSVFDGLNIIFECNQCSFKNDFFSNSNTSTVAFRVLNTKFNHGFSVQNSVKTNLVFESCQFLDQATFVDLNCDKLIWKNCSFNKTLKIKDVQGESIQLIDCGFSEDLEAARIQISAFQLKIHQIQKIEIDALKTANPIFQVNQINHFKIKDSIIEGRIDLALLHVMKCYFENVTTPYIVFSGYPYTRCKFLFRNVRSQKFDETDIDIPNEIDQLEVDEASRVSFSPIEKINSTFLVETNSHVKNISITNISDVSISHSAIDHFLIKNCRTCSVHNSELEHFYANDSVFRGKTSFRFVTFHNAPEFFGATLYKDTTFSGCIFPNTPSESLGNYRVLKEFMGDLRNDKDEMRFMSLELKCHHDELNFKTIESSFEKICSICAAWFNDYGLSLVRPIWWIIGLALFGGIVNSSFNLVTKNPEINVLLVDPDLNASWKTEIYYASNLFQSFYLSLINSIGPLKLLLGEPVVIQKYLIGQTLSFIQNIVSSILIFMFVTGIKRRFKLS